MILTRGLMLAALVGLAAMPRGEAAAPAQAKKGHEKVFTGVVTHVHHGKNGHGTITVRGHDHGGKATAQAGKGKGHEGHSVTFHVGAKTVFISSGQGQGKAGAANKGNVHVAHFRNVHAGEHVAIHHHGHQADEVRIVHHHHKGKANNNKAGAKTQVKK